MKYWQAPGKVIKWLRPYLVFSKPALFISGLVFTYSLVERAVVDLLMSYITDNWEGVNLNLAAAAVNAQEFISAIAVILVAYISDAYLGYVDTILITTATYTFGLVLLWAADTGVWLSAVGLLLISVGKAGREPPLKEFLADQLREQQRRRNDEYESQAKGKKFPANELSSEQEQNQEDTHENPPKNNPADQFRGHEQSLDSQKERLVEVRTEIWWRFWWFLAVVSAFLVLSNVSWQKTFIITAAIMLAAYWLFLSGCYCYYRRPTREEKQTGREAASGNLFALAYRLLKAAILKPGGEEIYLTVIPVFRWLAKADNVEPSPKNAEEVNEIKSLSKMVPLWATFLVYSLVEATGSTFFLEQTSNLILNSDEIIILALIAIRYMSRFIISYLSGLLIRRKWGDGKQKQRPILVRIGVGMVSSILCCFAAWLVEVYRLRLVHRQGVEDDTDAKVGMSALFLFPQFCLLGLMEGLAEDGLEDFFCDQVAESLKGYGEPFVGFLMSVGKLVNIVFIFILRDWFRGNINWSHLDRYYLTLTILSSMNLCLYCYVSYNYIRKEEGAVTVNLAGILEDGAVDLSLPSILVEQDINTTSVPSNGSQSTQSSLRQTTRTLSLRRSKTLERD